jgi:hypothetical protein
MIRVFTSRYQSSVHRLNNTDIQDVSSSHITDYALASWFLGAPDAALRELYKRESSMQKAVIDPPEPIITDNFADHLGEKRYFKCTISFTVF